MADPIIDKILKVKELAERGEAGEKTAAERRLKKMLKKHNLRLEDLQPTQPTGYVLECKPDELKLAIQIVFTVTGHQTPKTTPAGIAIETSPANWALIQSMFAHYLREYKLMQDSLFAAFVTVNQLFPKQGINITQVDNTPPPPREQTAEYKSFDSPPPQAAPPTIHEQAVQQYVQQQLLRIIPPKPFYLPLG
jgi:hypothetical protein